MKSYAAVVMLAALSAAQKLENRDIKEGIEFTKTDGDVTAVISDNWVGELRVTDTTVKARLANTLMSTVTLKKDLVSGDEV